MVFREYIYISERKLGELAHDLRDQTRRHDARWSGRLTMSASLPGVGRVEAEVARASDDDAEPDRDRELETLLAEIEATISPGLADLDEGDHVTIDQGTAFRFRRDLRFGVGASDDDHSIRALVMVDDKPPVDELFVPGLLLHGAARHVRPQYRPPELDDLPGARSGSGTGTLFAWLAAAEGRLEQDSHEAVRDLRANTLALPGGGRGHTAHMMYSLFARDDWMRRLPQLVNGATCEGIAYATHVAVADSGTVVFATPLFVRSVPRLPLDLEIPPARARRRWLRRS